MSHMIFHNWWVIGSAHPLLRVLPCSHEIWQRPADEVWRLVAGGQYLSTLECVTSPELGVRKGISRSELRKCYRLVNIS